VKHISGSSRSGPAAVEAAGCIPALVQCLRGSSSNDVIEAAALALQNLARSSAGRKAAIVSGGAVPVLVQLLGSCSGEGVIEAVGAALDSLN